MNELTRFAQSRETTKLKKKGERAQKEELVLEDLPYGQLNKAIIKKWKQEGKNSTVLSTNNNLLLITLAVKSYLYRIGSVYRKKPNYKEPTTPILVLVDTPRERDEDLPYVMKNNNVHGLIRGIVKIETYRWLLYNKEIVKEDIGCFVVACKKPLPEKVTKIISRLKYRESLFIVKQKEFLGEVFLPKLIYEDKSPSTKLFVHEVPLGNAKTKVDMSTKKKSIFKYFSTNYNYAKSIENLEAYKTLEKAYKVKKNYKEKEKNRERKRWVDTSLVNSNSIINQLLYSKTVRIYTDNLAFLILSKENLQVCVIKVKSKYGETNTEVSIASQVADFNERKLNLIQLDSPLEELTLKSNTSTHCLVSNYYINPVVNKFTLKEFVEKTFDSKPILHIIVSTYYDIITKENKVCNNYEFVKDFITEFRGEIITIENNEEIKEYV